MWSFGCVLYDMLAGRAPFAGDTIFDTLAAFPEHEPDQTILPADTPLSVRRLLRRCLGKGSRETTRFGVRRVPIDFAVDVSSIGSIADSSECRPIEQPPRGPRCRIPSVSGGAGPAT